LGVELIPTPITNATDIERSIDSFAQTPNGGLLMVTDGTTIVHRDLVIALTARYRLPAVYGLRLFVTAGGLMSYSTDIGDQFERIATYVDRVLRGAKPSDLPVQTPVKYETAINLKTAKALGLTVPPGLLVAADEVIE
jgi:putative ABC transport system substrate-binding protein